MNKLTNVLYVSILMLAIAVLPQCDSREVEDQPQALQRITSPNELQRETLGRLPTLQASAQYGDLDAWLNMSEAEAIVILNYERTLLDGLIKNFDLGGWQDNPNALSLIEACKAHKQDPAEARVFARRVADHRHFILAWELESLERLGRLGR